MKQIALTVQLAKNTINYAKNSQLWTFNNTGSRIIQAKRRISSYIFYIHTIIVDYSPSRRTPLHRRIHGVRNITWHLLNVTMMCCTISRSLLHWINVMLHHSLYMLCWRIVLHGWSFMDCRETLYTCTYIIKMHEQSISLAKKKCRWKTFWLRAMLSQECFHKILQSTVRDKNWKYMKWSLAFAPTNPGRKNEREWWITVPNK